MSAVKGLALPINLLRSEMSTEDSARLKEVEPAKTPEQRAELRSLLGKYPVVAKVAGDLARATERMLIEGNWDHPVLREALGLELSRMRREFGYTDCSELERMLIDRLLACWLNVQRVEQRRAALIYEGCSFAQGDYWGRELARANTSFLRASKALAQARRLLRMPVVQLNVARQQLNVAAANVGEQANRRVAGA
jgi:hypothetical protein